MSLFARGDGNMCEVVERFKKEGCEQAKQEDKQEIQEMKNKFAVAAENLRKIGMPEDEIRSVLGNYYDDL